MSQTGQMYLIRFDDLTLVLTFITFAATTTDPSGQFAPSEPESVRRQRFKGDGESTALDDVIHHLLADFLAAGFTGAGWIQADRLILSPHSLLW